MPLAQVVEEASAQLKKGCPKKYADLKGRQRGRRLHPTLQLLRTILQDEDLSIVPLGDGGIALQGGIAMPKEDKEENPRLPEALRIWRLVRIMRISVRDMLRMPRRCSRGGLALIRRRYIPYWCKSAMVTSEGAPARTAAANRLEEVVHHEVHLHWLAQSFNPRKDKVLVVLSADASCTDWRYACSCHSQSLHMQKKYFSPPPIDQ